MDAPPDLRITISDVRRAGYCPSGARRWFEANGFDFRAFVKGGVSAADLTATGDALAARVVTKRMERGRG